MYQPTKNFDSKFIYQSNKLLILSIISMHNTIIGHCKFILMNILPTELKIIELNLL